MGDHEYPEDRTVRSGHLENLVATLEAIVWEADPVTLKFSFVSERAEGILGYPLERWLDDGDFFAARIHPEDRDRALAGYRSAVREGGDHSLEYRASSAEGRVVWMRDRVHVAQDERGRPTSLSGVLVDTTSRKATEAALEAGEERYRRLVESSPDAILVHSGGVFVYANEAATRLLGARTPGDLIGLPTTKIVHPDYLDIVAERMGREERGETVGLIEEKLVRLDGSPVDVEVVGIPFVHEGRASGQIIVRDVSERKRAEAELRETQTRYRALVEQIPAVLYIDAPAEEDVTVYISPQLDAIFGLSPEEWTADPELWYKHLHPDECDEVRATYRRGVSGGGPFSFEYRMITPRGLFWVHDEAVALKDATGRVLVQGVMSDITERKLAEQVLAESGAREREVTKRLRALDEMKNTFLQAVSHELRTPLTTVLGLALTLERQAFPQEQQRDLGHRLAVSARKLERLLNDLLDVERLSRGTITARRQPVDVAGLLDNVVKESADIVAGHVVEVRADPVVADLDPAKVERIVENLLTNALRHAGEGAKVWVRATADEDGLLIVVEDDGPGVPDEIKASIFEPFVQGPTPASHAPGTGIGLSLVARFAELHGGRAWVQDRPEGGASFRVFLPGGGQASGDA